MRPHHRSARSNTHGNRELDRSNQSNTFGAMQRPMPVIISRHDRADIAWVLGANIRIIER